MAHEREVVRVDSKGRVTIPAHIREELGMHEGAYAIAQMDHDAKAVTVSLFAGADARLIEMRLKIPDRPGALARVARTLSELNIDLVMSSSRTIKKGDSAEWVVIADFSQNEKTPKEISKKIIENRDAASVEFREMSL
jgi:bifunctional DNA-binding transcriptional regulator/antitoxin component of YhaV-PrlF toxin-antitoxin module